MYLLLKHPSLRDILQLELKIDNSMKFITYISRLHLARYGGRNKEKIHWRGQVANKAGSETIIPMQRISNKWCKNLVRI